MAIEETDLRKDLEAAFEQHTPEDTEQKAGGSPEDTQEPVRDTQTTEGQEAPAGEAEGLESPETRADGRDAQGRFKPKAESKPEGTPAPAAKPAQAATPEQQAQQPPAEALTAPAGWKAGPREQWKNIPRAAQEEILRREKETAQTIRQSSQARQLAQEFQNTINPFLPLIQAQNSNPMQAVKNLMTTAAGLSVGTAVQKAQIVREIIQNYGVDIQTLDQVLSGNPVQQGNVQQNNQMAPPPWANPIFQFMNTVQQQRSQREQQIIADAEAETETFAAKHEFFEDVREEMADLMEVAAKRGVILSMEDAYNRAVTMHPDISTVVSQRAAAAKAKTNNIQKNRNAASSITGAPRNGPTGAKPGTDDRRAAIEEAWESQSGR